MLIPVAAAGIGGVVYVARVYALAVASGGLCANHTQAPAAVR